ncbi:type II secretion system major pseudopilin GspG [Aminobacter sp. BE322]|uniref:type II secretion system major pseudopilin GspG n=1 Tax=unclassified Aminobacter TaxID=2644704 RepID=UPI003D19EA90
MVKTEAAFTRRGRRQHKTNIEGFTLVELLVVLAIIALVATLATPQVLRYLGSAKTNAAKAQIRNVESALELYYIDNARYPTTDEGLSALMIAPKGATGWTGPYLKGSGGLDDPWGKPYQYELSADGSAVKVRTLGRDGSEGGTGEDLDISN